MRVVIEARALAKQGGGIRTYVQQLTQGLQALSVSDSFSVVGSGQRVLWQLPWWLNHTLPREIAMLKPDVVHFTKAAVPLRKQWPAVVTIYDVIPILFPASQLPGGAYYWRRHLERAAQSSDHIITISQASKRDIVQHLQVSPEKITVTPLAVDANPQASDPLPAPASSPQSKSYILYVGTIEPRKNVPALIRSFANIASDIPHQLVIVGRPYKGDREITKEIAELGIKERVQRVGFVAEAELIKLYREADLFVLPSIYEGWGFPAQEAMMHGTPVIVSDGGSLPEVVGDAGIVVPFSSSDLSTRLHDYTFEGKLADAVRTVLHDSAKQEVMAAAGKMQVGKRAWTDIAQETLAIYHKVSEI